MTNTSTPVKFFKREAKILFKQVKANDDKALARVTSIIKDSNKISLMRVQHVIAVEHGFSKWEELINSSDFELQNAINKRQVTLSQLKPRSRTPLSSFYLGPKGIPTSLENETISTFFDQMTQREQEMYLNEDARAKELIGYR
ncbi:MAG: hypothetical protein CME63_04300 [Halobacteriovoraceae bacterium]|nr:hypothetical protein [Halobacteriovoraceae bacterium]|tara:strand:+ start:243238 stop:243666 length:429 start_codon:yes stop_codon:yes gene_type:complete